MKIYDDLTILKDQADLKMRIFLDSRVKGAETAEQIELF